MHRLLIFICFLPAISWAQSIVSGRVIDKNSQPLGGVMVFFEHTNELNTVTDSSGYFFIDYSDYEIPGSKLIFYKEGYREKSLSYKKLGKDIFVVLESLKKKKGNRVIEDDIVELDENVIYSSFNADHRKKVYAILDSVAYRHPMNYPYFKSIHSLNGYHSLSEKVDEEREDTILYLKNPLHFELPAYDDSHIHLNSNIILQPNSILFVKNQKYNVPKDSPFFFNQQISWIAFINKDVFRKRRLYDFKIKYEDNEYYDIEFSPKHIQKDSWSGILTIRKDDYAVIKIETQLEFNRKNSYTIVSKSKTKNTTSLIYFEGAKIELDFSKSISGIYQISNIDSYYRIIHVGADPYYTPQFIVQSKFKFEEGILPEECKVLPLNELLFAAFHKNYNYND